MPSIFPFTAIVGQDRMKLALILNAINTQIGGVLVRGERGTAKSTAARALAELLPQIDVVEGCHFGCNPKKPDTFCDECLARMRRGEEMKAVKRKVSMIDLPVSATNRGGGPTSSVATRAARSTNLRSSVAWSGMGEA